MGWESDFWDFVPAQAGNGAGIQEAEMTGPTTCRIGDMTLQAEDLYFCENLVHPIATAVAGHCPADGELKDKTRYLPALAAGDKVVLYRLNDTKYIVLGKLVSV